MCETKIVLVSRVSWGGSGPEIVRQLDPEELRCDGQPVSYRKRRAREVQDGIHKTPSDQHALGNLPSPTGPSRSFPAVECTVTGPYSRGAWRGGSFESIRETCR